MPLDPQVAAHYGASLNAASGAALPSVEAVRASMDQIYNDRSPHPAVFAAEDHAIPCPWGKLPVRLYRPGAEGPYPVLLYYHGGGFVLHNIASHDSLCRMLCNACGCAVVSVGYRLAPESPFPACMEDGYAALQWVADNGARLGLDPARIALGGDSAGASISAAVSLLARDRRGPKVSLQILCYGPAGCRLEGETESMRAFAHGGYVLNTAFLDWCQGLYCPAGTDPDNPYLNPGRAEDLTGLPKTLSITAEYDPLRDDGEAFAQALQEAGNDVTLRRVPGVMHGFLLLWEKFDVSRAVIADIAETVRGVFGL